VKIYAIEFKTSALKELQRLPKTAQIDILESMKLLAADPYSRLLPTRKMEGGGERDLYRLRVQEYRVVYEIMKDQVVIYILRLGHRKDVYRV